MRHTSLAACNVDRMATGEFSGRTTELRRDHMLSVRGRTTLGVSARVLKVASTSKTTVRKQQEALFEPSIFTVDTKAKARSTFENSRAREERIVADSTVQALERSYQAQGPASDSMPAVETLSAEAAEQEGSVSQQKPDQTVVQVLAALCALFLTSQSEAGADELLHLIYHWASLLGHSALGGFAIGAAASCLAEAITCPLDTIKVRRQLEQGAVGSRQSLGRIAATIVEEDGLNSLWNGVSAGCQRQLLYGGVRLGIYSPIKGLGLALSFAPAPITLLTAGLITGILGTIVANPTDVVKVRMQGGEHTSSLEAYKSILKTEGLGGMMSGLAPNMARGALVTAVEFPTFDAFNQNLLSISPEANHTLVAACAAFLAGIVTTVVVLPVDTVKSRVMSSQSKITLHKMALAMARHGGIQAFYKGFQPAALRLSLFAAVMFGTKELLVGML